MKQAREKPKDGMWWLYPAGFLMLAIAWIGLFAFETVSWVSLALGLGTGIMVTAWVVEVTGNKYFGSTPEK
jgi:hypothetical protein